MTDLPSGVELVVRGGSAPLPLWPLLQALGEAVVPWLLIGVVSGMIGILAVAAPG